MRSKSHFLVAALIVAAAALVGNGTAYAQTASPSAAPDLTYSRYVSPAQCVEATKRLTSLYWRDKRLDTLRYTPATDSVPTPVRNAVRACAARFTVKGVPTDQLLPLGQLELVMGEDRAAQEAFDRLSASVANAPADRRSWILDLIVHSALQARPLRLPLAQRYLAQIDALGASAAFARLSAHEAMAGYEWTMGDVSGTLAQSDAAIAGGKAMSRADQFDLLDTLILAFSYKKPAVFVHGGLKAASALLDTASLVLMPIASNGSEWAGQMKSAVMQWMGGEQNTLSIVGTMAKPVHADYWFGGVPGDTVFPKPGHVTLLVFLNPAYPDFYMYSIVRRLHDKYAARGLDLVYMAFTSGSFRNTVHSKPANEVAQYQRWFIDYLHLPMTFAIEESQFGRLPDGRRQNTPMMNEKNYSHGDDGILIGKDGKVDMIIGVRGSEEVVLDRQIEAALSQ